MQTGDKVFIRTVTYHHVGEVTQIADGFVHLKDASWVADSGRFHKALAAGTLSEVEYAGDCQVALAAIVDVYPWVHALPVATR